MNKLKAPWTDYDGNLIYEGDIIKHPNGDMGKVIFFPNESHPQDAWRVDYGDDILRLGLQIGYRGMAIVINE